jgi:ABC-type nickel/cobalt efflux system permease component RcnA
MSVLAKLIQYLRIFSEDHPTIAIVGILFTILTGLIASYTLYLLFEGQHSEASNFASVASAFASILIVMLTGAYVISTKNMVQESKQLREDERQRHREQREREKEVLRKSLRDEISIQEFDFLTEPQSTVLFFEEFAPMIVYEANSDRLGLLTDEERQAVTHYYREIHTLSQIQQGFRELPLGEDGINLSEDAEQTTVEFFADQVEELKQVQKEAVTVLEENIE